MKNKIYKDVLYILKYYNLEKYIEKVSRADIHIRIKTSVVITNPTGGSLYYDDYPEPFLYRIYKTCGIQY